MAERAELISGRTTFLICGVLLLAFAANSFSAALTKNATIDEPSHSIAGWLALRGDFRFETANPSLWKMWAALGNVFCHPKMTFDGPVWTDLTWNPPGEVAWFSRTLYGTPGNDGDAFVNRSRAMMLVTGVAAGALLARWTYRLAGPIAAIVASAFFTLDPTVLAHAALAKSDVTFSMIYLGLAGAVWALGNHATLRRVLLVAVLCGIAMNVKYSGIVAIPIVGALLFFRAVIPTAWPGRWAAAGRTRMGRLSIATAVVVVSIVVSGSVTWASYDFRFRVARSESVRMDLDSIRLKSRRAEADLTLNRVATDAEVAAWPPGRAETAVEFADRHRLLPEAMLAGFLYQEACTRAWPGFLDGEHYGAGRWDYFPKAILYKTPIAELAALAIAAIVLACCYSGIRGHGWTLICLGFPSSLYTMAAMTTHMNIGVRHMLPVEMFAFCGVGVAASVCFRRRPRLTGAVFGTLIFFTAVADYSAWPDYIPFFNDVAAGDDNGLGRLGDSNLDWGQDVKQLTDWQRQHPATPLYTYLFTTVKPEFYGIRATPLPSKEPKLPPGVVAVSATHIQGIYAYNRAEREYVLKLIKGRPVGMIGKSIYLFNYPGTS